MYLSLRALTYDIIAFHSTQMVKKTFSVSIAQRLLAFTLETRAQLLQGVLTRIDHKNLNVYFVCPTYRSRPA